MRVLLIVLTALVALAALPARTQTVPPFLGHCLGRKLADGRIVVICNQPICPSGQQAVLNVETGATPCSVVASAPAAPTNLTIEVK